MVSKKLYEGLESEEKYRSLFEFAPDGIYLNDLKGNFVDSNKIMEELTGYKKKELIGKNFLKLRLLSPMQIPKVAALLSKNMLGKSTGPDEFVLNHKDGSKVVIEIRTIPVKIKDKTLVFGIAHDITHRKIAEEEIKRAKDELQSKVKEMERFNKLAVGRELKMIELKKKIKKLESERINL